MKKSANNSNVNKADGIGDKTMSQSTVTIASRTDRDRDRERTEALNASVNAVETNRSMPGIQLSKNGKSQPFESTNKDSVGLIESNDRVVSSDERNANDEQSSSISTIISEMSSLELNPNQSQTNASKPTITENGTENNGNGSHTRTYSHTQPNQQIDNRRNYNNYRRNQFSNASHGFNLYNNRRHNNYNNNNNNNGNNGQNGNNYSKVFTNRTYYRSETNRSFGEHNHQNRNNFHVSKPKQFLSPIPVMPPTDYYNSRPVHYCSPYDMNYFQPFAYFIPPQFAPQPMNALPMTAHSTHSIAASTATVCGSGDHHSHTPPAIEDMKKLDETIHQRPDSRNDIIKASNGTEMGNINMASFVPFQSSIMTPYPPKYLGVINVYIGDNGVQYYYFISIDPPNIAPYQLSVDINGSPILPSNCFIAQ